MLGMMKTRAGIIREIRKDWPAIVARAKVRQEAYACRPGKSARILGSSLKVRAGEGQGYLSAVAYLSPAWESGRNLCPRATPECAAACLGHNSGLLVTTSSERARLWKTTLRLGAPHMFFALLRREIAAHERKARKLGMTPVVRLDGSSDVGDATRIAPDFPGVKFYDYTKAPARAAKWATSPALPNYDVTFSYSGRNESDAIAVLASGGRVAVVFDVAPKRGKFKGGALPASWNGYPVVDGDETDLRFLDPGACVVGLRFKAASDRAGHLKKAGPFVVRLKNAAA